MRFGRRASRVVLAVATATALLACTPDGQVPQQTPASPRGPAVLTFSVYGSPDVIAAYTRIAADYTAEHPGVVVNVRPHDDHAAAVTALRSAQAHDELPSIFQISHEDLDWLREADAVQPVDELLVEREVDFGDDYPRSGMNAFTDDARLQCMPTEVSPLVAYVNTSRVNLADLLGDDEGEYNPLKGWSVEQLAEAAMQASTRGRKGLYIAPTLEQVAPMLLSGGGSVVDDEEQPTSLTLSEESTREALQQVLEVVRNPRITFSEAELQRRSAVERFRRGGLGIIFGYRDLTAQLRQQGGLNFAVMPLPKLGGQVTSGRMSAMCLPKDGPHSEVAGDFLAHLVSEPSMQALAATGEFVPSNLDVLNSAAFTQPNLMPENAGVFADQVRRVRTLPHDEPWETIYAQANKALAKLFNDPVIEPLEERLAEIDEASRTTLRTLTEDTSATD